MSLTNGLDDDTTIVFTWRMIIYFSPSVLQPCILVYRNFTFCDCPNDLFRDGCSSHKHFGCLRGNIFRVDIIPRCTRSCECGCMTDPITFIFFEICRMQKVYWSEDRCKVCQVYVNNETLQITRDIPAKTSGRQNSKQRIVIWWK